MSRLSFSSHLSRFRFRISHQVSLTGILKYIISLVLYKLPSVSCIFGYAYYSSISNFLWYEIFLVSHAPYASEFQWLIPSNGVIKTTHFNFYTGIDDRLVGIEIGDSGVYLTGYLKFNS